VLSAVTLHFSSCAVPCICDSHLRPLTSCYSWKRLDCTVGQGCSDQCRAAVDYSLLAALSYALVIRVWALLRFHGAAFYYTLLAVLYPAFVIQMWPFLCICRGLFRPAHYRSLPSSFLHSMSK
jgi:hypothetical protein